MTALTKAAHDNGCVMECDLFIAQVCFGAAGSNGSEALLSYDRKSIWLENTTFDAWNPVIGWIDFVAPRYGDVFAMSRVFEIESGHYFRYWNLLLFITCRRSTT